MRARETQREEVDTGRIRDGGWGKGRRRERGVGEPRNNPPERETKVPPI